MTNLIVLETKLLTTIETLFSQAATKQDELSVALLTVSKHVRRIKPRDEPGLSPRLLPVCRYLPDTLGVQGTNDPLITALSRLLPTLAWIQNPNYQKGNMPAGFLDNYGYADIVSTRGLLRDDQFALGILLLGPNTEYPPHVHPAEEVYHTIGGAASWWQTGQNWGRRSPGSFVYHSSGVAHAMRTGVAPVCLLYAWWGDVQIAARLSKDLVR